MSAKSINFQILFTEKLYIREYTSLKSTQKLESGLLCVQLRMPVLHSHAADILASTLRSFRLKSQLLNLADKPDVNSLLLQIICTITIDRPRYILSPTTSLTPPFCHVGRPIGQSHL